MRGQANLPALAVALVVLTATTGLALALADGAFAGAERDAGERHIAVALTERLVSVDSPLTSRANVLRAARIEDLSSATLDRNFPVARGHELRIRLGGRTLVERGDPVGGVTMRRVVLVERRQTVTYVPPLRRNETTIPRRTRRATLRIDPPPATTVRTVRANGRVVLHNRSGLRGTFDVRLSRFETTTLTFETDGPLTAGTVTVTYYPARMTKAMLVVTVDA